MNAAQPTAWHSMAKVALGPAQRQQFMPSQVKMLLTSSGAKNAGMPSAREAMM